MAGQFFHIAQGASGFDDLAGRCLMKLRRPE
jgi:hypothetical protein